MRKIAVAATLAALLSGCAPWIGIHKIDLGMTKSEVMQQMGKPNGVTGNNEEEYLYYIPINRFWERYYVYLVNGKVRAYGRLGGQPEPGQ